jgi:hypothetical protein
VRASSEAESRPRGRPASCEVESHPSGRPALERDGVSLVQRCVPRAKRNFTRGGLGLTILVGRQGRGLLPLGYHCLGRVLCFESSFVSYYLRNKIGFPLVI